MQIGRKIYYELSTGNVILDTGERQGSVSEKTIEQDIESFTVLSERNRNSFDVVELPYGQYAQDFIESRGNYRVNPETKEVEFSYPDPSQPEQPQQFQTPLTNQIEELKSQLSLTQDAVNFLLMGGM